MRVAEALGPRRAKITTPSGSFPATCCGNCSVTHAPEATTAYGLFKKTGEQE